MILRLTNFIGEIPRVISRNLPDTAASSAENVRLDDGGLTPFRKSRLVDSLPVPVSGYKTIVKHDGTWYGWESFVKAVPGPVAQDRLYVTGDGSPKMIVGGVEYELAVPSPTTKLTAALSGTVTSENGSTRLYVYTYVTDFGEESEPCPISDGIYWKPGQTVTLSGFQGAPAGRNITKQRIYRSQTSFTGTQLYFIAERNVSSADFTDNIDQNLIAEPLPSLEWNKPVDTLKGIVSMPNGMMAAFSGKDVYFCEPYRPHAWPEAYMMTVDYDVVALGVIGATLVVMTTGNPYTISGGSPGNMYMEKLELNLPCLSAYGVQDLGYSVVYPSHDGLVSVSTGGARVLTEQTVTRNQWRQYNPSFMFSGQYDGKYFASYNYYDQLLKRERTGSFVIDTTQSQPFLYRTSLRPTAYHYDIEDGRLYYAELDGGIYEWDSPLEVRSLYEWKSKEFFVPKPTNFGSIMIETSRNLSDEEIALLEQAIIDATTLNEGKITTGLLGSTLNAEAINVMPVNADSMVEIPEINQTVQVNIYADDVLVASVDSINEIARLPAGFLARKWQVEISGDTPIDAVTMSNTAFELSNV